MSDAQKRTAKDLGFTPVALAVDHTKRYEYVPEGQDHIPAEHKLKYVLRPPTKSVIEQVQNTEIDFQVSEGSDKHTGHLRSGTSRKLFVINCLAGWDNLYKQEGVDDNGDPVFIQVPFTEPGPASHPAFRQTMEKNYEMIPDDHVTGIVNTIRSKSKIQDTVEGKSETTTDGGTD